MCRRQARLPTRVLLFGDRLPEPVDDVYRVARKIPLGSLQVFCPQPLPRGPGELTIAGHDVHFAVVEERVLVEVRRAERQPAIVDDPDLRVDVHRARPELVEGAQRTCQEAAGAVVRFDEVCQLATRVVASVVRICGQEQYEPELL